MNLVNNFNLSDEKLKKLDYLVMFLMIAVSGFPFFTANNYPIITIFIFLLLIFITKRKKLNSFFYLTIFLLIIIITGQYFQFKLFRPETNIALLMRWSIPFFGVMILGLRFFKSYVQVIYLLTIISFIIFFSSLLFPQVTEFLYENVTPIFEIERKNSAYEYNSNILIYTIKVYEGELVTARNSGPFWEPGAFAGFLIMALIFNLLLKNNISNRENIVFIIGILTTLSTSGYIALLVLLSFATFYIKKSSFRYLFIGLFILMGFLAYTRLPFIYEKIERQLYWASLSDVDYEQRDRMVSARVDMEDVMKYPLFGRGTAVETRYSTFRGQKTELEHRNNGITDFAVKYGFFFWIFFFYNYYKSFKKICIAQNRNKTLVFGILITIFIIGFSQGYFQQIFFIGIYYLHTLYLTKVPLKSKREWNEVIV